MSSSVNRAHRNESWVQLTVNAVEDLELREAAIAKLVDVQQRGGVSPSRVIMQLTLLDAADQAFTIVSTQIDDYSLIHLWFFLPEGKNLREDARFELLMKRTGVSAYWAEHGTAAFA